MSNDFQLRHSWFAAAVLLGLSGAAFAQEATPPEIDVMKRIAEVYDQDGDDRISLDEFREFTRTAWRSMDTNGQGAVNKEEFMKWDPGFSFVAAERGKADSFTKLKEDIFDYWDSNDDGIATTDEVMANAEQEFKNSDTDGDGYVTGKDLAAGSPTFAAFIFGASPAAK